MKIEGEHTTSAAFSSFRNRRVEEAMRATHEKNEFLQVEKFQQLPVTELRLLSSLYSTPMTVTERYGSIGLNVTDYSSERTFIDIEETDYSLTLALQEPHYRIHLTPFSLMKKDPAYALESVYLLNNDMQRMTQAKRDELVYASIIGNTNDTMANYAQREWGFRQHSTRIEKNIFIATTDLIPPSDAFIQQLETTQQSVYERALSEGKTSAQTQEEYEKELRIVSLKKTIPTAGAIFQNCTK